MEKSEMRKKVGKMLNNINQYQDKEPTTPQEYKELELLKIIHEMSLENIKSGIFCSPKDYIEQSNNFVILTFIVDEIIERNRLDILEL